MFHRRDVAKTDAAARQALSSYVVDHIYDYMVPSTWAGVADKLLDHDENGNLKYNFFTDFNKVFNPAYDNQGFVGLVGADEWADKHPELTEGINLATDILLPIGMKGVGTIPTPKRIVNYRLSNKLNKPIRQRIQQEYGDNVVYKSELDWSPEKWLSERIGEGFDESDIASLKSHVPEYRAIERDAKANGTWLRMPDGSIWDGDARDWVMMQSQAYK